MEEKDVRELSTEEMEAVTGGALRSRDYMEKGCAATVEPGSNCWGTDGGCTVCNIKYEYMPVKQKCPRCNIWLCSTYDDDVLWCKKCCYNYPKGK